MTRMHRFHEVTDEAVQSLDDELASLRLNAIHAKRSRWQAAEVAQPNLEGYLVALSGPAGSDLRNPWREAVPG